MIDERMLSDVRARRDGPRSLRVVNGVVIGVGFGLDDCDEDGVLAEEGGGRAGGFSG